MANCSRSISSRAPSTGSQEDDNPIQSRREPADVSGMKGRRLLVVLTLAALMPALPATAASNEPWVFEGGGWGHGVGLSQYGAFGQAVDGRNATEILQFYYQGTSVVDMPAHWTNNANGLWVGLVSNTSTVDIQAVNSPLTICHTAAGCETSVIMNPGVAWKFEILGGDPSQCRLREVGVAPTPYRSCDAVVNGLSPNARLKVNGKEFARGAVKFVPSSSGFHVVATLKLEEYLYGLAEVPSSWPAAALRAQAVIGRSFAVATAAERGGPDGSGKLSSCGCHLRSTTADQAYAGWSKEDPANYGVQWKAAVDGEKGRVLVHPQSNYAFDIAKAYYSSSNGGASENVEDVWGGSALPWLRSVDDPWSSDPTVNPLAKWSVKVTDSAMAAALGWDFATDAKVLEGPPGVIVRFTGIDGGSAVSIDLNGTQIAAILRSHGFGYFSAGTTSSAVRVSPYITKVSDPPGFDDIRGHLFEADIDWLVAEGVTKGCNPPDNTRFCPDDSITRGQMAAFLTRYLDLPAASKDYFNDDNGSLFEDDINRLAASGVTKGCSSSKFCPDDLVNRGQMAAFLVRAFGLVNDGGGDLFIDDNSSIFEADIDKLGTSGITRGCNPPQNDRYCPTKSVSRGAMAAFLHRADDL